MKRNRGSVAAKIVCALITLLFLCICVPAARAEEAVSPTATPDTAAADTATPDTAAPDTAEADTATPEAEAPDAATPAPASAFTLHEANAGQESRLSDQDVRTCVRVRSDRTIIMALPAEAATLYLAWHERPVSPVLRFTDAAGAELLSVDADEELLYQSFAIPAGAAGATLSAAEDFAVSEMAAYETLPPSLLLPQKPDQKADVLLIAAHTGDEQGCFGGLLPIVAGEKGYTAAVLFISHPSRLAQEEAMLSLRACGVEEQPYFASRPYRLFLTETEDAIKVWNQKETLLYLVEAIRRCQPELVIIHDPAGEDGEATHAAAAELALEAVKAAAKSNKAYAASEEAYGLWSAARVYAHAPTASEITLPVDEALGSLSGMTAHALAKECLARYSGLAVYRKTDTAAQTPYYTLFTEYRTPESDAMSDLAIEPMPTPTPEPTPTSTPAYEEPEADITQEASQTEQAVGEDGQNDPAQNPGKTKLVRLILIIGAVITLVLAAIVLVRRKGRVWLRLVLSLLPLLCAAALALLLSQRAALPFAAKEPTPEPTTAATATPAPTPTPVPTPTPSPTPNPDDAYFLAPDDTGEEIVFNDEDGLYSYKSSILSVIIERTDTLNEEEKPLRYYVAHIRMRAPYQMRTGFGSIRENGKDPAMPFRIARRYKAVLAITGDNMIQSESEKKGVLLRNGQVFLDNNREDSMVMTPGGMGMFVMKAGAASAQDLLDTGVDVACSFGPSMIVNGELNAEMTRHRVAVNNPRVGVGYIEEGHLVAICVEGRIPHVSHGMNITEYAALFQELGCTEAYNLDGGASSCMVFMGEYINKRLQKHSRHVPDMLIWGYSDQVPGQLDPLEHTAYYDG